MFPCPLVLLGHSHAQSFTCHLWLATALTWDSYCGNRPAGHSLKCSLSSLFKKCISY